MQISSMGNTPSYVAAAAPRMPERAESGPDRDNDGDETRAVAAAQLPAPPPGRGGTLNIVA